MWVFSADGGSALRGPVPAAPRAPKLIGTKGTKSYWYQGHLEASSCFVVIGLLVLQVLRPCGARNPYGDLAWMMSIHVSIDRLLLYGACHYNPTSRHPPVLTILHDMDRITDTRFHRRFGFCVQYNTVDNC